MLKSLALEIHENAKAHGWWDTERPREEIFALIHSEWSEALEEARKDVPLVYVERRDTSITSRKGQIKLISDITTFKPLEKPEGVLIELVDGVIRMLDWLVRSGGIEHIQTWVWQAEGSALYSPVSKLGIATLVCQLHEATVDVYKEITHGNFILAAVLCWIRSKGYNAPRLIRLKHEYNKTRPMKHGKLF